MPYDVNDQWQAKGCTRHLVRASILTLATLCMLAGAARADDDSIRSLHVGAIAGSKQMVSHYDAVNPDCSVRALPVVRLQAAPSWGRISIETGEDYTNYTASSIRAKCNLRKVPMVIIYYTPQADYVGEDQFDVTVVFDYGGIFQDNYSVTVIK